MDEDIIRTTKIRSLKRTIWADVFKMLKRKKLIRCIQPVGHDFHVIAERNVDTIHVICNIRLYMALHGMIRPLPLIVEQMDNLAGSQADLAKFQLVGKVHFTVCLEKYRPNIGRNSEFEHRHSAQKFLLEHCAELFRGANLEIALGEPKNGLLLEQSVLRLHLDQLQSSQLNSIKIEVKSQTILESEEELFQHPTILGCPKVRIKPFSEEGTVIKNVESKTEENEENYRDKQCPILILTTADC